MIIFSMQTHVKNWFACCIVFIRPKIILLHKNFLRYSEGLAKKYFGVIISFFYDDGFGESRVCLIDMSGLKEIRF